jgi:hypothetical protein
MFHIMPYYYYGKMDPEDIRSIIAYIRTLSPIENDVPASAADFPMNFILNTIPKKADPHKLPSSSDQLAYGGYIISACACIECHTPVKHGQIIEPLAYSGGREFILPDGSTARSANLTSDRVTGIGTWTEDMFIRRFKAYADSNYTAPPVKPGEYNTLMPWTAFARMKKEDLAAIYAYLHQVKPITNIVNKFSPYTKN